MKQLLTAYGICALIFLASSAPGAVFQWDGSTDSDWQDSTNWVGSSVPSLPGSSDEIVISQQFIAGGSLTADFNYTSGTAADYSAVTVVSGANEPVILQVTATVKPDFNALSLTGYSGFPADQVATLDADEDMDASTMTIEFGAEVQVAAGKTVAPTSILIDANSAQDASQLEFNGAGILDSSGEVRVKAYLTAAGDARLYINNTDANEFRAGSLVLEGSTTEANGDSILQVEQDFAVDNAAGTDTTFNGFSEVDMGDYTFQAKDLVFASGSDVLITGSSELSSIVQFTSLTDNNMPWELKGDDVVGGGVTFEVE